MTGTVHDQPATVPVRKGKAQAVRLIRWAVLAALLAIVVTLFSGALQSAWTRLDEQPVAYSWHLAASLVLFALAVPVSGVLWGRVLGDLVARHVPTVDAAAAHSVSWVLKYMPGQVGSLVYKIFWGSQRGYSSPGVALSFVYENLFLQVASLVPAIAILPLTLGTDLLSNGDFAMAIFVAFAAVAMLIGLGPGMRRVVPLVFRRFGQGEAVAELRTLSLWQCIEYSILFVIPRVLNAAGFVFIVCNVAPIDPQLWLPLGSIYVLAGAIGILAIFVPSGLGVREGVIVFLASPIIGAADAIIAAVLARLLSVLSDGMVVLIYLALQFLQARRAT